MRESFTSPQITTTITALPADENLLPQNPERACPYCGSGEEGPEILECWEGTREFQLGFCCERAEAEGREELSLLTAPEWSSLFSLSAGLATRGVAETRTGTLIIDWGLSTHPISRGAARRFIVRHHRHARAPQGDRFRFAVKNGNLLVGVATIGRPVARGNNQERVAEITRVCVREDLPAPGLKHKACSTMYREAARRAQERGFERVISYTLQSENGYSLLAARFKALYETDERRDGWDTATRPREAERTNHGRKICWERRLEKNLTDLNQRAAEWRARGRRPVYGEKLKRQTRLFPATSETEDPGSIYHVASDCPHCVGYSTGSLLCLECRRPLCWSCHEAARDGKLTCSVGRVSDQELERAARIVIALRQTERASPAHHLNRPRAPAGKDAPARNDHAITPPPPPPAPRPLHA